MFYIKEYNNTHLEIGFLGMRLKFPKREYAEKLKNYQYEKYKKNNIDITTIPPAEGQIREIQLANLVLLKELDYVCKKNGLKYWINFGTLLGAVRHKGFIPWDDDIDVSMMRDDYGKIIDAFKNSSRNPDIYAEYTYLGKAQTIIKVKYKKCNLLFVDIFPCDYSKEKLNKKERLKKTKLLYQIRKKLKRDTSLDNSFKVNNAVKEINSKITADKEINNNDIQFGMEYFYSERLWIHSYETIFPLKTIRFENFDVMGINKPEEYLTDIFGNYMTYPRKFGVGHSMHLNLSKYDKQILEELKK